MIATTCAGLLAALKTAAAGAVLALPPGTCVLTDTIIDINPSSVVTVTAQDPAHPPVLAELKIANSSNLLFSHVEMTTVGNPDPYYGFRMYTDTNIAFDQDDIHGDPTKAPGEQISGFYIKPGTNISITNSRLHDMDAAIVAGPVEGLKVTGNQFYRLSKGGLEFSSVGNLLFSNNACTDFRIAVLVHSDCLQGYTAGSTSPSHDLTITDNLLTRGAGDGFQGLFIGDELGLGYKDITVSRNVVKGGMWDSIYIEGVTGALVVTDNYVTSWSGNSPETGAGAVADYRGYLMIYNSKAATQTITNNAAQAFGGDNFAASTTPARNFLLGPVTPVPIAN